MTTHAPLPPAGDLAPPDEAFWVRYSAHHELPLSAFTSFALHLLGLGLLLLIALKLASFFTRPTPPVPVLAVRLADGPPSTPGGDGQPGGLAPQAVEVGDGHKDAAQADAGPVARPDLPAKAEPRPPLIQNPDPKSVRPLPAPDPSALKPIGKLLEEVRGRLHREPGPGRGDAGPGPGSGKDRGPGPGGGGKKGTLTPTERRNLRWTMHFDTDSGADYLRQLQGLGAVLVIPVREGPAGTEYKVVRDLSRRPARLLDEDISRFRGIRWGNNDPRNVASVIAALGLDLRPRYFLAYMPAELEATLFELEKAHAQGHSEREIKETWFRVEHQGGRSFPVFESIRFRGPHDPDDEE
jgi:hypothetical protein